MAEGHHFHRQVSLCIHSFSDYFGGPQYMQQQPSRQGNVSPFAWNRSETENGTGGGMGNEIPRSSYTIFPARLLSFHAAIW
jgi:hypothetical protein